MTEANEAQLKEILQRVDDWVLIGLLTPDIGKWFKDMQEEFLNTPIHPKTFEPWIGVDLDGTLASYDCNAVWKGADDIGAPVQSMVERVRHWIDNGVTVKIMTARAAPGRDREMYVRPVIEWCRRHIGFDLEVTAYKDGGMIELWDDRAVQVEPNTGRRMDGKE